MTSALTHLGGKNAVRRHNTILGLFIAIACFTLAGCDEQQETVARSVPVHVIAAQLGLQQETLRFSGIVVPRVESQLAFRISGAIVERMVDTGEVVAKGAVLARLDDAPYKLAVQEAEADLTQGQATQARLRRDVERQRTLVKSGAITAADFDALETLYANAQAYVRAAQSRLVRAYNDIEYTKLSAPTAGTVAFVQAEVGHVVVAGTPVLRLALISENEVQVDVQESVIGQLSHGQSAKVRLLSQPDIEFAGTVREIARVADHETRTYRVRIALPELPTTAWLGMTASVRFDSAQSEQLQLPITALFQQGDQPAVWVLPNDAQRLVLRPVSLTAMGTDTITVADGIVPGEHVVVAGVHRLDADISVRVWDGRLP